MLKKLFFMLFIRPFILIITGVHASGKEKLPLKGPCIIASNHNSHLDTMVIMSLFPLSTLNKIRPVAAADYFMKNRWLAWFSLHVIGIIPLKRKLDKKERDPLFEIKKALDAGDIIILYPEGSRGKPEELGKFKTGIAHLASKFPSVPIVTIHIHGAGKALPKGEALFVPFIIDINIGETLYYDDNESYKTFTQKLEKNIKALKKGYP